MIKLLIFLTFSYVTHSQVTFKGKCPEVDFQKNFDLNKYLGTWYEAEKFFAAFELNGKCVLGKYSLNENGTMNVHNERIDKKTGKLSFINGNARFAGKPDEAKLIVTFPTAKQEGSYWVLKTDYTEYSIVWSCTNIKSKEEINIQFAWILTRNRKPSKEILDEAYAVFAQNKLDKDKLTVTDQEDCPNDK